VSTKMLNLVWERFPGSEGKLTLMLLLADLSNDFGSCHHKRSALARKTRLSQRSVQRIVGDLEEQEWVRVIRHATKGWANDYHLNVFKLEQTPLLPEEEDDDEPDARETLCLPSKGDTGEVFHRRKGDTGDIKGDIGDIKGDAGVSPLHDHDMTRHDGIMGPCGKKPVENFSQATLGLTAEPARAVELPFGLPRRLTISDQDSGGEFSVEELLAAYRQVTQNQLRDSDRKFAEAMMRMPFSLRTFMALMGVVIPKAKEPPASLHYFERAFTWLWNRCTDRIVNEMRGAVERDAVKLFTVIQNAVREEIALWERS
jgi:hypothetical protein